MLVEASRRYGIPEAKLNEIIDKGPHWWERLLQDLRPYRLVLQAALCELAQEGNWCTTATWGTSFCPILGTR